MTGRQSARIKSSVGAEGDAAAGEAVRARVRGGGEGLGIKLAWRQFKFAIGVIQVFNLKLETPKSNHASGNLTPSSYPPVGRLGDILRLG